MRGQAHRDRRELPEVRHQPRVGVRRAGPCPRRAGPPGGSGSSCSSLEPALEEGAGVDARGAVALDVDLVAAAGVVLAAEEVVEADLVEAGRRLVGRDVAADLEALAVGVGDHDRGVPADERADPALDLLVAGEPRLALGRDRVDVVGAAQGRARRPASRAPARAAAASRSARGRDRARRASRRTSRATPAVSSGSMSGSWVGSPSWITDGASRGGGSDGAGVSDASSVTHVIVSRGRAAARNLPMSTSDPWLPAVARAATRRRSACVDRRNSRWTGAHRPTRRGGSCTTRPEEVRRELDRGWSSTQTALRGRRGWGSSPAWSSRSSAGTTTPTTSCASRSRTPSTPTWSTATTATSSTRCCCGGATSDGDLVDGLVDALTDLVGGGSIWLLTPKVGRPSAVDAADIAEAAPIAGLSQTTTAAVSKDWSATRLVAPKTPALTGPRAHRAGRASALPRAPSPFDRLAHQAAVDRLRRQGAGRPGSSGPTRRSRWPGSAGPCSAGAPGRPAASRARRALPRPGRARRRARRAHLRRAATGAPTRWPARCAELGVGEGDSVAVMARNHRGFIDAASPSPSSAPTSSTSTPPSPARSWSTCSSARTPAVVIHDEEFTELLAECRRRATRVLAWTDGDAGRTATTLEPLIDGATTRATCTPPDRHAPDRHPHLRHHRHAQGRARATRPASTRPSRCSSRMPLRRGWRTHIAAPLFHTWGFAHLALAMLLGSTVVLRRTFDPEAAACETVAGRAVRVAGRDPGDAAADPGAAPRTARQRTTSTRVEVVAASGSALPGDLAHELDGPLRRQPLQHLRLHRGRLRLDRHARRTCARHPATAGKPPLRHGREDPRRRRRASWPQGEPGRIFVGNGLLFEGYTGGGHKDVVDGLMSSGDVGRFDDDGRLYVEGRDDDMIVSGGENVFPQEVEDCLARHERGARGGRDRRRRRRLRQAAAGLRRARRRRRRPRTSSRST